MMKKTFNSKHLRLCLAFILFTILCPSILYAQKEGNPFKGHYFDRKENIHLQINLYEPTLQVPNMEFLGDVNGYMYGNIYGIWLLTKFKIKDNVATLRLSHDSGADSQTVQLTILNDSTLSYEAINGNAIRKVLKKKLVKIPSQLIFNKVD